MPNRLVRWLLSLVLLMGCTRLGVAPLDPQGVSAPGQAELLAGRGIGPDAEAGARPPELVAYGTVTLVISIPPLTSPLRTAYISSATKSVVVVLNGKQAATVNVVSGQTAYTAKVRAPVGENTFVFSLYDQLNGSGNQLATGSTTKTIEANKDNEVKVTLTGLVRKIKLTVNNPLLIIGQNRTVSLVIEAVDASDQVIMGNFSPSISLKSNDSAVLISPSSVASSSTAVTLTYDGQGTNPVTLSAGGTGIALRDITNVMLTPVLRVQSVTVSPSNPSVAYNKTITLSAVVKLSSGNTETGVTWSSADTSIATVASTGVVTGKKVGAVTIKATSTRDTSKLGSTTVTVFAETQGVSISPSTPSVYLNKTATLSAMVTLSDTSTETSVTWSSGNTSKCTISSGGVVAGVAVGTCPVTATSTRDTSKKATVNVSVVPEVQSVSVLPTSVSVQAGKSASLSASVKYTDGTTNGNVTWASSDAAVATVAANGVVTGKKTGSATITAKAADNPSKSATATVSVTAADVVASPISLSFLQTGATQTLTASQVGYTGSFTASSSNTSVVAVTAGNSAGEFIVTPKAAGSASITITGESGKTATIPVEIMTTTITIR